MMKRKQKKTEREAIQRGLRKRDTEKEVKEDETGETGSDGWRKLMSLFPGEVGPCIYP